MNKIVKYLAAAIAAASLIQGCKPAADDEGKDCNCEAPAVVVNGATESSVEVNVDPKGLDELYYICVPKSQGTPSPEQIVADGAKLEKSSFTLSGLEAQTEYIFALCARCPHDNMLSAYAEFTTLVDDAIVAADGFMAYDGFDSASGMYRLNIMMSSKSMSGTADGPYEDILLFVYLKNELKRIDEHYREVPFGKITPFYTDGTQLGDMVYYVGKHFNDPDGTPNAQGTAVFCCDSKGVAQDIIVADDTENSYFEIVDNGDGTYTVKGMYSDRTNGKTYKFKYTDDKKVFSIDQTSSQTKR